MPFGRSAWSHNPTVLRVAARRPRLRPCASSPKDAEYPCSQRKKSERPSLLETLRGWLPEIIVVVAYGRILPKTILELAPHGCLNVHYSLLPKYRGAAPAAWTIINGERQGGVTTMKLVEKMDAGAIYLQQAVALTADETTGSLQTKLTPIGARLLIETLRGLKEGTLAPREQDESSGNTRADVDKRRRSYRLE